MQISPGEKAQDLHRDDFIWQRTHTRSEGSYEHGSDVGMGIIVAGTETTMENGATVVRPHFSKPETRVSDGLLCSSFQNHIDGTIQDDQRPRKHGTPK